MQLSLKKFLEVPQINIVPSHSPRGESEKSTFTNVLQKEIKTLDDAMIIYEQIKGFRCFDTFFSQNLKTLDMNNILNLCRSFKYERIDTDQAVFLQGSPSNNKFYVILSGQVAVIIGKKNVGEFGEIEMRAKPHRSKAPPKLKRCPQIILTPSVPDENEIRRLTPVKLEQKRGMTLTVGNNHHERRSPSAGTLGRKSGRDLDTLSDRGTERDSSAQREREVPGFDSKRSNGQDSSRGMKKMKAVVNMMAAVQGMQKEVKTKVENLRIERVNSRGLGSVNRDEREDSEDKGRLNQSDEEEKKEFEEYAAKFGKLVRYLEKGESFGELALKTNAKRSATILCRTDCEFLILEKQQYDMVFGQVQKEKEEFLKIVFANAMMSMMSTENLNYLAYFFKTDNFAKGQYIVREGVVSKKEAKVYVIQRGECALEKHVTKELTDPFDRTKVLSSSEENVAIAVLKAGSIIGEELIETRNTYEYSVKVISDHVLVQSVHLRDCMKKFPKDFQEYLSNNYHQKKSYRDATLEKAQIKSTIKEDKYRKEHIYCVRNADMNSLVTKSAVQGLSRHLNRENKVIHNEDPVFQSITISPKNKTLQNTQRTEGIRTGLRIIENQQRKKTPGDIIGRPVTTRIRSGTTDEEKRALTQDERLLARFDFLDRLPDVKKETEEIGLKTLENLKFFPHEKPSYKPRQHHTHRIATEGSLKDYNNQTKDSVSGSLDKTKGSLIGSFSSRYLNKKRYSEDIPYLTPFETMPSPVVSNRILDFNSAGLASKKLLNFNFITSPYDLPQNNPLPAPQKSIPQFLRSSLVEKSQWQESPSDNLFASRHDLDKKRDSLRLNSSSSKLDTRPDKENQSIEEKSYYQGQKMAKHKTPHFAKINTVHLGRRKTEEITPLAGVLTLRPILGQVKNSQGKGGLEKSGKENRRIEPLVLRGGEKRGVGAQLRAGTKESLFSDYRLDQL